MYKITGKDLEKLIPLLKEDNIDYPITLGVLDGTFSGYAVADDSASPRKALIIHKHIGFAQYIGDDPCEEESVEIADSITSYRSDRSYCNWVELAHCPKTVENLINRKFHDIKSYNRISWNHDTAFLSHAAAPSIPAECSMAFLNKDLFRNKFLRYETEMFWDSIDVFLKTAFGTVVLDAGGKFMGVCSAVSASDNFFEINIEVRKDSRRRGIGYAVAHRYIEECYKRQKIPHWDCHEHNAASRALAKKLGFKEAGKYPLLSWEYAARQQKSPIIHW